MAPWPHPLSDNQMGGCMISFVFISKWERSRLSDSCVAQVAKVKWLFFRIVRETMFLSSLIQQSPVNDEGVVVYSKFLIRSGHLSLFAQDEDASLHHVPKLRPSDQAQQICHSGGRAQRSLDVGEVGRPSEPAKACEFSHCNEVIEKNKDKNVVGRTCHTELPVCRSTSVMTEERSQEAYLQSRTDPEQSSDSSTPSITGLSTSEFFNDRLISCVMF